MRCYVCAADSDEDSAVCGYCGADLTRSPGPGGSPWFVRQPEEPPLAAGQAFPGQAFQGQAFPGQPEPPFPAADPNWPPPPRPIFLPQPVAGVGGPPERGASLAVAWMLDALFCVGILLLVLLAASSIAVARGASATGLLAHLSWLHLLLASLVLGVYWAGTWLVAGRTPGVMVVNRTTGVDQLAERAAGFALLPMVLAVIVAAVIAGLGVPVGSAVDVGVTDSAASGRTTARAHPTGSGTAGPPATTRQSATPSQSAPSTGDPRTQAMEIEAVLAASSASRAQLRGALDVIDACGDVPAALGTLRTVGLERQTQLVLAQALAVDGLSGGLAIRSTLVEALTYSFQADQAFVTWAGNVLNNGCGQDGDYAAGVAASGSAQAAKIRLVGLWNPVAATYGLETRTEFDV